MMTRRTAEQRKPLLASSVISGYISGMPKQRPLPPSKSRPSSSAALAEHRKRLRSRGLQRLEVQVRGEDAPLVRAIVAALTDPGQADTRAMLLRQFTPVSRIEISSSAHSPSARSGKASKLFGYGIRTRRVRLKHGCKLSCRRLARAYWELTLRWRKAGDGYRPSALCPWWMRF
jgi:hypothetical protein